MQLSGMRAWGSWLGKARVPRLVSAIALLGSFFFATTGLAGPKVVILTATFGAGHDAAARQVKEDLIRNHGVAESDIVIKNCQDFMPDATRGLSVRGFDYLQGHQPRIYDAAFNAYMGIGEIVPNAGLLPTGRGFRHGMLLEWIRAQNPDVVLVTWYGGVEAIDTLRRQGHLRDLPLGWVHTDNVSNGGGRMAAFEIIAMAADTVFVPGPAVERDFIASGVPRERVILTGMPVRIRPREPLTAQQIVTRQREARARLGLQDRTTLMIEGGSNGVGNYPLMIASILATHPNQALNLIAACGRNENQLREVRWLLWGTRNPQHAATLYQRLQSLRGRGADGMTEAQIRELIANGIRSLYPNVELRPLGFGPITDYRLASNLVSTKPGGLSTAEMAAEGIPMLIRGGPDTASGQELFNVRRFREAGLAAVNETDVETGTQMRELLRDAGFFERFYRASEEFRRMSAPERIAEWVYTAGAQHLTERGSASANGSNGDSGVPALTPQGRLPGVLGGVVCTFREALAQLRRTFSSVRPVVR